MAHEHTPVNSLLGLPLEIRLHIYPYLLTPSTSLRISSLFIRDNYRSVFMTQQGKDITLSLLRICKQITNEALPVLYAQPFWRASCKFEALASQIGIFNFGLIKRMQVDADDLPSIVGSLLLDMDESGSIASSGPSVEKRLAMEADAVANSMSVVFARGLAPDFVQPVLPARRLRFHNLEVLELEAYQTMALTSRGNRKARLEGLRLCKFAKEILAYHPILAMLVQAERVGNGGSDAVDFTMGRVCWRFLRHEGYKATNEYIVDIEGIAIMLRTVVEMSEQEDLLGQKQRFASWNAGGTYQQYPYSTLAAMNVHA